MRPSILSGKQENNALFRERMKILYAVVILLALLQSLFISILADLVVFVLYGPNYQPAVSALRIVVWYTTFSYIGSVRDIWILANSMQKLLWKINLAGAVLNVLLNALLIPKMGVNGAAVASLLTQVFTNVIIGYIVKPIRENNGLIIQSLDPRYLISLARKITVK